MVSSEWVKALLATTYSLLAIFFTIPVTFPSLLSSHQKPTEMKNKNWVISGLIAVLIASSFLIIGFSSHASAQKEKSTCCSQKMKDCDGKMNRSTSGDMIMENLSRQFLGISALGN